MEFFALIGIICVFYFLIKFYFKIGDIIYEILKKILSLFRKKG